MNRNADDHVWPLLALCAALAAVLGFAIIASALAGLLAARRPDLDRPSQAGTLLARLASHLSDPALAWPAADRRELPGAAELHAVLLISLIAVAVAVVARLARWPAGCATRRRASGQRDGRPGPTLPSCASAAPSRGGSRSATTAAR